jgi:hypothetical protein
MVSSTLTGCPQHTIGHLSSQNGIGKSNGHNQSPIRVGCVHQSVDFVSQHKDYGK